MDRRRVIGHGARLPWHLSDDLKNFRAVTWGKPLIMGRKTHASIGRPLPGRKNIVLTRASDYRAAGCVVAHSLAEAWRAAGDAAELMIMGGASLYAQSLKRATRMYLTEVRARVDGDVFFPEFDRGAWREVERSDHQADKHNEFDFSFVVLEKIV